MQEIKLQKKLNINYKLPCVCWQFGESVELSVKFPPEVQMYETLGPENPFEHWNITTSLRHITVLFSLKTSRFVAGAFTSHDAKFKTYNAI